MGLLGKQHKEYFEEFGFLPLNKVFNPEKLLDPIIKEYEFVLDKLCADLYQKGDLSSKFEGMYFGDKITKVMQETGKVHEQYFDFSLPFNGVTPETPMWFGEAIFEALICDDILDAVESLIGPEIYSNPVQHVRIKPPEKLLPKDSNGQPIIGATGWHQDHGVVHEDADETEMLTVWFPLSDCPVESGPLKVVPGSHKGKLLTHCNNKFTGGIQQIPEHLFDVDGSVPIPLNRGDIVVMHKKTVHGSLSNVSNDIRWSFDLRFNPVGQNTGREIFPGFVARSRKNPDSQLRNPVKWKNMWEETKDRMSKINQDGEDDVRFRRWDGFQADCA